MCDVVYVLLVERVAAQVLADRQVVAVFQAAGAKGVDMPTVDEAIGRLDAALVADPRAVDPDERVLRDALGLSRAG